MKTMGLLGGMSWGSSLEYYRIVNEEVKRRLGGLHSAKVIMYSLNFQEIEVLQHQDKWDELTIMLAAAAKKLEQAGADYLLICTNTMHKAADDVQKQIKIPILHIVDVTAKAIKKAGLKKVGLLGTKFTMEEDFYSLRLVESHGIEGLTPSLHERNTIHNVIYHELCKGIITQESKSSFKCAINNLVSAGAEGVILGCTEIPLLIKQEDAEVPLFDTTAIHAAAAVDSALA